MNVSFASERPSGSYALALPVWSDDLLNDRLASLPEAARTLVPRAAGAQPFGREGGGGVGAFGAEGARVPGILLVGRGGKKDEPQPWEKAGGALTAKLIT